MHRLRSQGSTIALSAHPARPQFSFYCSPRHVDNATTSFIGSHARYSRSSAASTGNPQAPTPQVSTRSDSPMLDGTNTLVSFAFADFPAPRSAPPCSSTRLPNLNYPDLHQGAQTSVEPAPVPLPSEERRPAATPCTSPPVQHPSQTARAPQVLDLLSTHLPTLTYSEPHQGAQTSAKSAPAPPPSEERPAATPCTSPPVQHPAQTARANQVRDLLSAGRDDYPADSAADNAAAAPVPERVADSSANDSTAATPPPSQPKLPSHRRRCSGADRKTRP